MGKNNIKIIFCALIFAAFNLKADTSTLPKGVRAFVYKHMNAQVGGKYGESGALGSYDLNEKLTLDTVSGLSKKVGEVVTQIKNTSPDIFNHLEIGSVNINAKIDVSANAFALAYGITDKIMVAVAAPYLNAKVNLKGGYYDSGQLKQAANSLSLMEADPKNAGNKENLSIIRQFINQLPTLESANLQDILVNYYGYKPLGTWEGSGFGDALFFIQYRYFETSYYKTALKLQADIPTGGTKDPDNLVAIPITNGYWGTSLESLNDFLPFSYDNFIISLNSRFKYNWPTQTTVRLAPNKSFPLTNQKETLMWEPGSVWYLSSALDLKTNNKFLGAYAQYTYSLKLEDIYRGKKADYDYSILSHNSNSQAHVMELGLYFSTVGFYLSQKFPIPFKGSISYSQVLAGVNSELIQLWNLGVEMYF
ncbi:MAG: hypothetical protein IPM57_12070 [Oligoflexia bacterium]|nr:hypothetical protein [Oligoflexia bacterium]